MTLNNNLTKQLMHKKLAADLTSLAHSILQMKNKEDVFALKTKAHEVYEKLAVLAFVEEYINNTPNSDHTKEELVAMVKNATDLIDKELTENDTEQRLQEKVIESSESIEQDVENNSSLTEDEWLQDPEIQDFLERVDEPGPWSEEDDKIQTVGGLTNDSGSGFMDFQKKQDEFDEMDLDKDGIVTTEEEIREDIKPSNDLPTLEEELKDTISADVVLDLFDNAQKKSLNDKLQGDIQIGLNDRIAFVKNLFGGSQEDFNRVVSQLNSFKTLKEAKKFINKMVKPDYDWTDKEEVEERFMSIVERKFSS
jgi:hypothetical protein